MTGQNKLRNVLGLVAIVVAIGLAFAKRDHVTRLVGKKAEQTSSSLSAGPAADPQSVPRADRGYRRGERRNHALELAAIVTASDGSVIYQLGITGDWRVTALNTTASGTKLHAVLEDARVTTQQPGADPARLAVLADHLESAVSFSMDPLGRVSGMSLDPALPPTAAGLLRSIVAYVQFSEPQLPAKSWSNDEADGSGRYLAQYSAASPTGARVTKVKREYLELLGVAGLGAGANVAIEIKKFEASFELDSARLPKNIVLHEQLVTRGAMMPELTSTADLKLTLRSTDSLGVPDLHQLTLALPKAAPKPLYAATAPVGASREIDEVRVGGRNYEDLMKELGSLPKANEVASGEVKLTVEQRQELDKVFSSLAALMRLDDEAVAQAVRDIHAGSPQSAMLRDALWNAGTDFAQEELVKLMDFFKEEPDRRFTMIGLGLVNAPTSKTLKYLQTMIDDPMHGRQAKLSLGSTVQHLKDTDPAAADSVVEVLATRYEKSKDPIERASYLDALGNTRYEGSIDVVLAALDSEESAERNAAVLALRHFPGGEVDDKIRFVAISDPDDVVRHTAISVIADRTPTVPLMEALNTLMRSDPILMVRRSAIMAGVTLREQVPAIGDTLAWVAKNDPEPKLRELAAGYL